MIRSLRTRLFLQVGLMIVLFALAMVVLNATCLEPYYVWQEKGMLVEQAKVIDALAITDYSEAALQLEEIEKLHGLWLLVLGPDHERKYSTSLLPGAGTQPRLPPSDSGQQVPRPLPFSIVESQQRPDGSSFQVQQDDRMNVTYLVYRRTLSSGDTLELRVLKNSLRQSVAIANRFLFWIGGGVLLLTLAWAFGFSRRFTGPILEMNSITKDMANLNFRRTCHADGQDEIGQLSESINHLSQRLDAALTDLQARNERLQDDIIRERNLEQMQRQFVRNVSHELKTPICIIQGYAEGLRLNVVKDEAKRLHYAQVINDEAQKMDLLVRDLLQLSQYQSGQLQTQLAQFNLTDLIKHTRERLEPLFAAQGIAVQLKVPPDAFVFADELLIEQVLTNYLSNAVAHVDQKKLISVSGRVQGSSYRITVFNSGPPIPDDELEQIWVSFYRGDQARSREQGRYGLGLSIVRAIMDLHHQSYGVSNVVGGVEFWFELGKRDGNAASARLE